MKKVNQPVTLDELREELRAFTTKDELKEELKAFTTKDELKEELKAFTTKDELKEMLKAFATKEDLERGLKETKEELKSYLGVLFEDIKHQTQLITEVYSHHDYRLDNHEKRINKLELK